MTTGTPTGRDEVDALAAQAMPVFEQAGDHAGLVHVAGDGLRWASKMSGPLASDKAHG